MCAIAGILGLNYNEEIIQKMLRSMARRGPDGNGAAMRKRICLLHTRLAIVDLEGGQQPMELVWQGRRYIIVYNGELYNTEQIRKDLVALGHGFEGHSDTEVLLHAFAQWSDGCLARLNGIYAFAVLCCDTEEVFLARDRMGVKPLFYKEHNGGILFASEIKTILNYPGVERRLDQQGVAELMLLGPGRIPGSGVFQGIRELQPGCCAKWSGGKFQIRRYWKLTDREHTENFAETSMHVRYLVEDAISRQMVADVPVGTFLSGGLDSSLITSVCARKYGPSLQTFSLDFQGNDKYFVPSKFQPHSDHGYIDIMRETLQTQHHWIVLTPEEQVAQLQNATIARDLPGMADIDFSLLEFCGTISQHVKVALSGECADEIFGGYPWYRDPQIREAEGFPWAQNTEYRASLLQSNYQMQAKDFVGDLYQDALADCDILPGTDPLERRMKEMVNLNQYWFMQTLLDRKDRMSMYHGLEVRVPFCDHRIAEYLYGVPWEMKDYRNTEKGLLRHAMNGLLPESILWRKKSPYPKTYDPKYFSLVCNELEKLLARKDTPLFSIIKKEKVQELIETEPQWPWYGQLMRRPQTIAYLLQVAFWLEYYSVDIV